MIGGRAGRFGIYDVGYITGSDEEALEYLERTYRRREPEVETVNLGFPQVLLGAKASLYVDERRAVMQNPVLTEAIAAAEAELGKNGRVLIRPSGTEALIRVMVEAMDADQAQKIAEELLEVIQDLQK